MRAPREWHENDLSVRNAKKMPVERMHVPASTCNGSKMCCGGAHWSSFLATVALVPRTVVLLGSYLNLAARSSARCLYF